MSAEKFEIEVTDTFGGEANYAWVRRAAVELPARVTNRALIKATRQLAGWPVTVRVTVSPRGDGWEVRPTGLNQVAFVY